MAEEVIETFVPTEWTGMNFDPLELDFLDSLTENFRAANNARHVNPSGLVFETLSSHAP